jgi:hypothetical protein
MRFRTGCVSWKHETGRKRIISGKYFHFRFEKNTIDSFPQTDYELIVESKSELNAQIAFELFISAITLVDAHISYYSINDLPTLFPYSSRVYSHKSIPRGSSLHSQSGIYKAALIAAKASFKKSRSIALNKYLFACTQHSNYLIDLDPFHSEYSELNRKPLDHLRYSYAIFAHYSIIEELELEVRASNQKPSKLNGQWNPVVKQDLENRLIRSKVDLSKKAYWNLRSRPTKIHPSDKLFLAGRATWARYSIRDSHIEIVDAIAYLSWLRSKIIAHKFKDSYLSISIYDVANANFLVRQLMLDIFEV